MLQKGSKFGILNSKILQAPTLLRGVFVLLGVLIETLLLWYSTKILLKPIKELYFILFLSIIYWITILFVKKLKSTLLYLTVFLFPFNRFLIIRTNQAYLLGRVSDYLLITLYFFEIPLYTIFLWNIYGKFVDVILRIRSFRINGITKRTLNKNLIISRESRIKSLLNVLLKSFLSLMIVSSFINKVSIFIIIGDLILLFDFILIINFLKLSKIKNLIKIFYFTVFIQSIIAVLQVILNSSVGLEFIGESKFNSSLFYIAKTMFNGFLRVRAYGTFSHPNVLAGFLFLAIILFIYDLWKILSQNRFFVLNFHITLKIMIFSFSVLSLYLTQSRTAILALSLTLLVLVSYSLFGFLERKKAVLVTILLSLILLFGGFLLFQDRIVSLFTYDQTSLTNRLDLADIAFDSVQCNRRVFYIGNGPGGYLNYLSVNKPVKTYYSFIVEPVHNVFLLFLSNYGVLGMVIFLLFFLLLIKNFEISKFSIPYSILPISSILFLVMSLNLDHYLVTLKQGVFLLGIFSFLISRKYK